MINDVPVAAGQGVSANLPRVARELGDPSKSRGMYVSEHFPTHTPTHPRARNEDVRSQSEAEETDRRPTDGETWATRQLNDLHPNLYFVRRPTSSNVSCFVANQRCMYMLKWCRG